MNGLITLLRAPSAEGKEKTLQKTHSPLTFKERLFNAFIFSVCAGSGFASIHAMQSGGIDQYVVSYGLIAGFFYGLLYGLGNGIDLVHGLGITIQPAETVSWSWQAARRAGRESFQKGCLLGVTIMVEVILVIAVISSIFNGWKYGLRFGIIFGLIVGLIAGVASILTGILISGWSSDTISDNHQFVQPNEGIRRSMSHAAFAALIFGPIGGIASGLMSGFSFGLGGIAGWYILGTGFMIVFGIIFAFHFLTLYGGIACVEHYVLRWFLWRKGAIPFNYVRFLDYASERILLRKVGGGYMFIHQLLLDYFATLEGHEHSTLKKQVTQATGKGKNVQG